MALKCKCGGSFDSIDKVIAHPATKEYPFVTYSTVYIKPGIASRRCWKCGKVREQKLRQSKKK